MAISAEERSRINRDNGRKGGPRTDEGKRRASMNALKHGLRAESLTLPNEDPDAVRARLDEWHGFYRPQSPAESALITKAVLSLQQSDRFRRAQDAILADQVRAAESRWDAAREEDVEEFKAMLTDDPASAVRGLKRSAAGCRWLLDQWAALKFHLDRQGCWSAPSHLHEATRLLGMRPEAYRQDADVYWLRLINLAVDEEANQQAIAHLIQPAMTPDSLRDLLAGGHPSPDHSRNELAETVADQVAELTEREEFLRTEIDDPSRAGAADRALVLDGEAGRLLHRYATAADGSFHRAYGGFLKARAKEGALVEVAEVPLPNEPNRADEAAEVPLPNEPKSAGDVGAIPSQSVTSDVSPARSDESRREVSARAATSAVAATPPGVAPLPNEPKSAGEPRATDAEEGLSKAA